MKYRSLFQKSLLAGMGLVLALSAAAIVWSQTGPAHYLPLIRLAEVDLCAVPTGGPTVHPAGDLTADATWRANDSPHLLQGLITVNPGVTLTIEPCVRILVAAGGGLIVDGRLVAVGLPGQTIRFSPSDPQPWGYIRANHPGTLELAYLTIEGAGSDLTYRGASLIGLGPDEQPMARSIAVRHVTISNSAGYGVWLRRFAAFSADSTDLVITGSGRLFSEFGAPLYLYAQAMGTIPTGRYGGNRSDYILVDGFPGINSDVTVVDHGLPYQMGSDNGQPIGVGASGAGDPPVTLTIGPGVTIRFEPGANGFEMSASEGAGALRLLGTAERPVVLTSAAATPAPGDWRGLVFFGPPGAAENELRYARILYAGGDCACIGYSCASGTTPSGDSGVVLLLGWRPLTAFMSHSEIAYSGAHGVVRGWDGAGGPDFTAGALMNSFSALTGCIQTNPDYDECAPCSN